MGLRAVDVHFGRPCDCADAIRSIDRRERERRQIVLGKAWAGEDRRIDGRREDGGTL